MRRDHPDAVAILPFACSTCGAQPEEWCVSYPSSRRSVVLHTARWQAAFDEGALPWQQMSSSETALNESLKALDQVGAAITDLKVAFDRLRDALTREKSD